MGFMTQRSLSPGGLISCGTSVLPPAAQVSSRHARYLGTKVGSTRLVQASNSTAVVIQAACRCRILNSFNVRSLSGRSFPHVFEHKHPFVLLPFGPTHSVSYKKLTILRACHFFFLVASIDHTVSLV